MLTRLVEWDGDPLVRNALPDNGVTEARLVHPQTNTFDTRDRRTDAQLVVAEQCHALPRVGPRGSGELLLSAISPLYQADRSTTSVLFLHGGWDSTVPPKESEQMRGPGQPWRGRRPRGRPR